MDGAILRRKGIDSRALLACDYGGRRTIDMNVPGDGEDLEIDRSHRATLTVCNKGVAGKSFGFWTGASGEDAEASEYS
jgi:hypothetical protein